MAYESPNPPPINLDGINHKWYENIAYGSINREVMDVFIPTDAVGPTPIVIYLHAGGFVQWDKGRAYTHGGDIDGMLSNGIAFATINYDYIETNRERKGILSCMDSAKRAIQFLKLNNEFFNLDKTNFIMTGASAGAGISAWLGYNVDLADVSNDNPLLRESTTIKALSLRNPQASYDSLKWQTEIFKSIPEWDLKKEYENVEASKLSVDRSFGTTSYQGFLDKVAYRESVDMLKMIKDNGGIPTRIFCPNTFYNKVVNFSIPDSSHSPYHGKALRDALLAEGQEVLANLNGIGDTTGGETELEFILRKVS